MDSLDKFELGAIWWPVWQVLCLTTFSYPLTIIADGPLYGFSILFFSVINGTAVAWGTKSEKALQSHNSYCSKDPVEVYWSSFAVHRDSPLKVTLACK